MKKMILLPVLIYFTFSPAALMADTHHYNTTGQQVSEDEYKQILEKWYAFIKAERAKKQQAEVVREPKAVAPPPISTTGPPSTYTPVRQKSVSGGATRTYPSDDLLPTPKAPSRPKRPDKVSEKLRLLR